LRAMAALFAEFCWDAVDSLAGLSQPHAAE
jgi:hypothetical protein